MSRARPMDERRKSATSSITIPAERRRAANRFFTSTSDPQSRPHPQSSEQSGGEATCGGRLPAVTCGSKRGSKNCGNLAKILIHLGTEGRGEEGMDGMGWTTCQNHHFSCCTEFGSGRDLITKAIIRLCPRCIYNRMGKIIGRKAVRRFNALTTLIEFAQW